MGELDKTVSDTWKEIEALENETRLLLESVRAKPKKSSKTLLSSSLDASKLKGAKNNEKNGKETKKKPSDKVGTLNLYGNTKTTVEILDDASPDSTPREKEVSAKTDSLIADQKKTIAKYSQIEASYRNLLFDDEQSRIKEGKDTFVPSLNNTVSQIEAEWKRLRQIEDTTKRLKKSRQADIEARLQYLESDRAAIKIQSLFRGHLGRRLFSLAKRMFEIASENNPKDWIEVKDDTTGDIWYFNRKTNKSQWTKPEIMKEGLPEIFQSSKKKKKEKSSKIDDGMKKMTISMTLPSIEAIKEAKQRSQAEQKLRQAKRMKEASERKEAARHAEKEADIAALKDSEHELGLDKLKKKEALLGPDGYFKPQLRNVVLDALLDTRFDNVSTVLADTRWFDKNEEPFPRIEEKQAIEQSKAFVENDVDPHRTPLVSVFNVTKKKSKKASVIQANKEPNLNDMQIATPADLTVNNIEHVGFEDAAKLDTMCFGCWSSGLGKKCALHDAGQKLKPSQTMLLCRNWDLDVMTRRYRSEELQEIFMKREASLRYNTKHKQFFTVTEQRHPIYRMQSQTLEKYNNRVTLFAKIKYWLLSLSEEMRQGNVHPDAEMTSRLMRVKRGLVNLSKIRRFSALNQQTIPLPPITGYSWDERCGRAQFLFKHRDAATEQEVDIIVVEPTPVPVDLYKPRQYHVSLPKTIPLPQNSKGSSSTSGLPILPANTFIKDQDPASWVERMSASLAREQLEVALAQVRSLTPVTAVDLQARTKRPVPATIKFATIGMKPAPENLAVGGLALQQLIYQIVSTYFPPQYGNFMVMDKASVSPGVSPEISITFSSLVMPPTVEEYVERPLEHPLTYRRVPTITLNSSVTAEDKHVYGINRPEQTGERESHGFRTTAWSPMLMTYSEIDPHVFTPGQTVVSLNNPKANFSVTTHADTTYPFCEPSTRDNSTLDFYHLLLTGIVSMSKAQIFTALTVQEPGQFQKAYRYDLPMGHVVVSVYRSWAFTQLDTIQEFKTDDGVPYWYHRKTGQTFWERPLYEDEDVSPLKGGTILDVVHPEEPTTVSVGKEGATRRYLQGDFRKNMLKHIETKKEAVARRRAATSTVKGARDRGVLPEVAGQFSVDGNAASSADMGSRFDYSKTLSQSMLPNTEPSTVPGEHVNPHLTAIGLSGRAVHTPAVNASENVMHMYENNMDGIAMNQGMEGDDMQQRVNVTNLRRGSNLDEGSWIASQQIIPPSQPSHVPSTMPPQRSLQSAPTTMVPGVGMIPGFDPDVMNQLSLSLGRMFSAMMNNMQSGNNAGPEQMISLGLGMGMALMQTGAVTNMVQGQLDMEQQEEFAQQIQAAENVPFNEQVALQGVFPTISEERSSAMSVDTSPSKQSKPSRVSTAKLITAGEGPQPIGLPYPTQVFSSDKTLDHGEEQLQREEVAKRLNQPLTTMEKARGLKVEPSLTDTPDVRPPKALTNILPENAEEGVREANAVPLIAYPELSTQVPGGAPAAYKMKPPAGQGTSFVPKEEELSQLKVPGNPNLRRIVMPLPVGFFDAIEAKHVATQAADYLPQVPNLPQTRNIGRVKPRSAASDWLMIAFDPWSAGKNPLGTEYVPSLMAKADKLMKAAGGKAVDTMESLRAATVAGAFVSDKDEEGMAQQRQEVTKAQVMAEDFKKLCSLCRHSKFSDAEQLINQPDWAVPIDYQDDQGNALIHVAAQNGSKRLVKLCLRRGANLNLQNLNGQTALHFAFGYGYTDVGDYLVGKGADDSIKNKDGLTCYEGLGARELALL